MPGIRFDFVKEAADLGPAVQMLFQTYSDNVPYPHKFNDALIKAHLVSVDAGLKYGFIKQLVAHEVYTLGPILEMIGEWVKEQGPDRGLFGMFEGTSCNYQLFERIEVLKDERRLQCPYKEMIEIVDSLGTQGITWNDVHEHWCIPRWKGFAKKIGFEIEVLPGETCCVRVKK